MRVTQKSMVESVKVIKEIGGGGIARVLDHGSNMSS